MGDSFIMIIAIMVAVVIMFVFPLMTFAGRTDDISQLTAQSAVTEFADQARSIGKITPESYNQLVQTLTATGNTYDVEIEVKVLDENPGKKTVQVEREKIGENVYYSIFTAQILETISPDTNSEDDAKPYLLKEGDMVVVKVKNVSPTLYQQLASWFNIYTISADAGGIVTATGKA